ncbi:hypothetical protein [Mesorhizobium sp. ES1-6]|uniref:nSTAND3 domain-containing NTPase n=1 Tax=Mesorhizobium sp. ES1-6 TaxID=2876626 RepID=UPI001CCE8F86|nr:hypothetical protein [Mesorhizobium sp. ES1-6]MBZ9801087.1 hypothetical protein [Mesorhizobium sp. ES1-6]
MSETERTIADIVWRFSLAGRHLTNRVAGDSFFSVCETEFGVAPPYDFGNLTPPEFEALGVDLAATELGLRFETFTDGADRGIDGRYQDGNELTIVQVKHLKNSKWSDVRTTTKGEAEKLKELQPHRYLYITSYPLTPHRKDELQALLDHPSVSSGDIWGQSELNALLRKHGAVERRHPKLWISGTTVLRRMLNNDIANVSQATIQDIERVLKIYVPNESVGTAQEILDRRHCLVISGPPGVGKTTLSHVLAAGFIQLGWELIDMGRAEDGWKAFDSENNQVFLYDDFLGKIGLQASQMDRENERLIKLFRSISRSDTKRLVLTSRSYILEAAREKSEFFDDASFNLSELTLSLGTYQRRDRALILYNHLYHSRIDDAAIHLLLKNNTAGKIIDHANYMPRIIEWMTDHLQFQHIPTEDYPSRFMETLNNPRAIWDKVFNSHISTNAQVLLYCMFLSYSRIAFRSGVSIGGLKPFFIGALDQFQVDNRHHLGDTVLEETLREISSSFVTVDGGQVDFINPSVQDFLARQVRDVKILQALLAASTSFYATMRIWDIACDLPPNWKAVFASSILASIKAGSLSGHLSFDALGEFICDLLSTKRDVGFVGFLRRNGLYGRFSKNEVDLPAFIDKLRGTYGNLPLAQTYARYLSQEVVRFVKRGPPLEDLAQLAENLKESNVRYSREFDEIFAEAATYAINNLVLPEADSDDEQTVINWLDNISSLQVDFQIIVDAKKDELLAYVSIFQMERNSRNSDYRNGPSSPTWPERRPEDFSDASLKKMFSTLQKR